MAYYAFPGSKNENGEYLILRFLGIDYRLMAIGLAEAGADIIGLSGTLTKGSNVEKEVKKLVRNFSPYAFDLNERPKVFLAIEAIKSEHPKVDILVNNAGIILRNPVAVHTDEDWDKVLSVNLDAPFILAREFGKEMLDRKYGKIIFTCSLLSFQRGINVPGDMPQAKGL